MEIITERLLLREFVDRDLTALLAYQADPRYTEFWLEKAPSGRQLLDMFRDWATERSRRNYQLAVTQIVSPHELMGSCGLRGHGLDATSAEFGLELAPQSWGHGYATEAARAILGFGFRDLGLVEVRGVSVTENWRVTEMVTRLGFTRLGSQAGPAWMRARGWSQTEWQLTRKQWDASESPTNSMQTDGPARRS